MAQRCMWLTRAQATFRLGLASEPGSVFARLGLAATHYARGQFSEALKLYATILYMCPKGPPELRLVLGVCC